MDFTLDQAMRQGINAHKAGRTDLAEKFYRAVLRAKSSHPDANHNLGVLIAGRGAPNMAIPHFKSAIMANPNVAQFWVSYVDSLIKVGKTEQAKTELETARKLGLKDASFGLLSNAINRIEGDIEPPHYALEELFTLQKSGDSTASIEQATALLERFPRSVILLDVIGGVYLKLKEFEKALAWFEKEIERSPDSAAGYFGKGEVFFAMADYVRAKNFYEEAIARNSKNSSAFHKLGNVHLQMGEKDLARENLERALELEPDQVELHRALSSAKKFKEGDAQIPKLLSIYGDEKLPDDSKAHICFALAKAAEDLGKYEDCYRYLVEGNALRNKTQLYRIENEETLFAAITKNSEKVSMGALGLADVEVSQVPIFVLGMPRSGTTLTEQIISAHSKVHGAGELGFVARFGLGLANGAVEPSKEAIAKFRNSYLDEIRKLSGGREYVVDKMPHNFRLIGLICAAFPEARIVHLMRDPAAVCWSNFKHYFPAQNLGYSNDLKDVVQFYQMYWDLMSFWRERHQDRIYDLDYEHLTVDQEAETRKLVNALGLDWEDACLSPQKNDRKVKTASQQQVRKEVYKGSSEEWRRYEPYLNGAFDTLPRVRDYT